MAAMAQPRLLSILVLGSMAWDKDGHEAIGMTTMSALQNGPTHEVKRLMHGKDAVDVAAWAHKVNNKYPWTVQLHFQTQPEYTPKCSRKADVSVCPGNKCMLKALKHFYGRLVNKDLVDIDWGTLKLTDADALKFLVNLIGDLHQPMHFGDAETDSGRNITVRFRGKTMSLYDMWDKEITQTTIKDSPGFWWGGWTHVQRTRSEYEKDMERWKSEGVLMFDQWADETAQFACEDVYRDPQTGKELKDELKDGVFVVSEHLFETWKREMLSKMLVAGARTAIVLNAILQQREGQPTKHLEGGTAVKMEDEEEEVNVPAVGSKSEIPKGTKIIRGPDAFLINLCIFLVVFAIFMYVQSLWARDRKLTDQAKRTTLEGGKKG